MSIGVATLAEKPPMMPQQRRGDPRDRRSDAMIALLDGTRPLDSTLSERLREATRSMHREVERSTLMSCLLRGRLDRQDYAALLANLLPVYVALERGLARTTHQAFYAPLPLARLVRAPALEHDLAALRQAGVVVPPLLSACLAHVDRIETLGAAEPERLVAHAYVRYLGDLAGGQILSRIVQSRIGAPVAFYDFGPAQTVTALAEAFRTGLDRLVLDAAAAETVVEEAIWAFDQHGRLFAELAPTLASCARD